MSAVAPSPDVATETVERWEAYLRDDLAENLAQAAADGDDTITVDWEAVYRSDPALAEDVVEHPRSTIAALEKAISEWTVDPVPDPQPLAGVTARVTNANAVTPIVSELREEHVGRYCGVRGQVSLASQVQPQIERAVFQCRRCKVRSEPIEQYGDDLTTPNECPGCERNGPFVLDEEGTDRRDHQVVEIVDPPGENPEASSDDVTVHLYDDLAGTVSPGERVSINGVVELETVSSEDRGNPSRRQPYEITARAVESEAQAFNEVDPERRDEIEELAERDDLQQVFVDSFEPDILTGDRGDKHKLAILLSLFGGSSDDDRDYINLFFIGAPGTGKSQYLQRAAEIAPKSVKASGKGASAAGLTASATQSATTGQWMLDPGALVLANGGVAAIDEFDKMQEDARESMHAAMENQEVPINKAGINTTLPTKTTVIAAANPKGGRFNRFDAVREQVDLGPPILSRFDLIFGVHDTVDEERDRAIAEHQHRRAAGDQTADAELDDELMTQYIAYARQHVHPTYEGTEAMDRLVEYYTEIRQESKSEEDASLTQLTPRLNDALRRLAQASARMHLRDTITMADAETAIELMDLTIGDTALEPDGTINNAKREGRTFTQEERKATLKDLVDEHSDADDPAAKQDVIDAATDRGMDRARAKADLEALATNGELWRPSTGTYRRA